MPLISSDLSPSLESNLPCTGQMPSSAAAIAAGQATRNDTARTPASLPTKDWISWVNLTGLDAELPEARFVRATGWSPSIRARRSFGVMSPTWPGLPARRQDRRPARRLVAAAHRAHHAGSRARVGGCALEFLHHQRVVLRQGRDRGLGGQLHDLVAV